MESFQLATPLIFILFSVLVALLWGRYYELHAYQKNRYHLFTQRNLAGSLKILHLTDLHCEKNKPALNRFFDRLAEETYDLIFLTGDIIDGDEGIPYAASNLKKLKARLGFFCVFGNHDYRHYSLWDMLVYFFWRKKKNYVNHDRVGLLTKSLAEIGIKILRNETIVVLDGERRFVIHGLDDPVTGRAQSKKLKLGENNADMEFLLTHSIDGIQLVDASQIDLSFSGHSHGGQIRVPWLGAIVTHTRMGRTYASGIVNYEEKTKCIIGRGLGTSKMLPFRFLCRPEVIVLDLGEFSQNNENVDKAAGMQGKVLAGGRRGV